MGARCIAYIIDHLSRWGEVWVLKNCDGQTVLRCFKEWVEAWGFPSYLLTDWAAYFHTREMKLWAEENKVNLLRVFAYHHRGNGIMEKYNKNLIFRIRYHCLKIMGVGRAMCKGLPSKSEVWFIRVWKNTRGRYLGNTTGMGRGNSPTYQKQREI